jgi:tetratricopeptide (TPR) repeat protein
METQGEIATQLMMTDRFPEAVEAWKKAIQGAEKDQRSDLLASYHVELANLYCHLGRAHASEPHFEKALEIFKQQGDEGAWVQCCQNFGNALMEQAKYAQALKIFEECKKKMGVNTQPLELAAITISLAQVYNSLGMSEKSSAHLHEVKALVKKHGLDLLWPYLNLLEGKFEIIQGHLGTAFRLLGKAAVDFEASGDLPGKIEVLLSITAPLLEHQLVQEAQGFVQQLSAWEEIKQYPALEHSIQLRRLAFSAFLGRWVKQDVDLVLQDSAEVGRTEDWLQFWFHLSLAAQRIHNSDLAKQFSDKAKTIADRISKSLTAKEKEFFLRRPDIARMFRLTESSETTQKVRAKRVLPTHIPADAAELAPPMRGMTKKKRGKKKK